MKALFYGIAISAVAGLSLGAVAQPNLSLRYRSAPQTVIAPAAQAAEYGADFTSRSGSVPDYVIGTDWVSPPMGDLAAAPEDPYVELEPEPVAERVDYAYARAPIVQEPIVLPEPPPPTMPSMGGGVAPNDRFTDEPPPPPQSDVEQPVDPWLG